MQIEDDQEVMERLKREKIEKENYERA